MKQIFYRLLSTLVLCFIVSQPVYAAGYLSKIETSKKIEPDQTYITAIIERDKNSDPVSCAFWIKELSEGSLYFFNDEPKYIFYSIPDGDYQLYSVRCAILENDLARPHTFRVEKGKINHLGTLFYNINYRNKKIVHTIDPDIANIRNLLKSDYNSVNIENIIEAKIIAGK